jgi:hypothetical protein
MAGMFLTLREEELTSAFRFPTVQHFFNGGSGHATSRPRPRLPAAELVVRMRQCSTRTTRWPTASSRSCRKVGLGALPALPSLGAPGP